MPSSVEVVEGLTLFLGKKKLGYNYMIQTLLGTKKGMTSVYDSRGRRVGATILSVNPNFITQIKSAGGKDGYRAVQLAYGEKKSTKKPQIGHLKKIGLDMKVRWLKEVRVRNHKDYNRETSEKDLQPGQSLKVGDIFLAGDSVKVSGTSKGKGFQGGVRRHGFAGGPKTHGQSDRHRAPGSIGATTTPGRVYKGKKMAGHMGVEMVSFSGLEVIAVDKKNNELIIKGGVPGPVGGLVVLEKQGKIRGYTPPPEPEEEEEIEGKRENPSAGSTRLTTGTFGTGEKELEVEEGLKTEELKAEEVKEGEENAG